MAHDLQLRTYGVALTPRRSVADGVTTNADPTVGSATLAFTSADLFKRITGTNIPPNSYVGLINSSTSIELSSSPTVNTPVNATGSGSGITLTLHSKDAIVVRHRKLSSMGEFDGGVWVPAAGDVKVSVDGQPAANIATLPTFVTDEGWEYVLSTAEITGRRSTVSTIDAASGKAITDYVFVVETKDHPAAMHPGYSATNPIDANVKQWDGDDATVDTVKNAFTDGVGAELPDFKTGIVDDGIVDTTFGPDAITPAAVAPGVHSEAAAAHLDIDATGHTVDDSPGLRMQTFAGVVQASAPGTFTGQTGTGLPNEVDKLVGFTVMIIDNGEVTAVHTITAQALGLVFSVDPIWAGGETPTPTSSRYKILWA